MVKQLVIMRGVSGSGKTTYVSHHFPSATVCSADHFFDRGAHPPSFDPKLLSLAHHQCLMSAMNSIENGDEYIVIDNTNTQRWEYEHYIWLGNQFGYHIRIIRLQPPLAPEILESRNVHQVTKQTILNMLYRFEDDERELTITSTE